MHEVKGFLIDLDGVVYQNSQAIPGAIDTLKWLAEKQIPHLFVTNTTSKPRAAIVDKLQAMGLAIVPERIMTPVLAAVDYLSGKSNKHIIAYVVEPTKADLTTLTVWQEGDQTPPKAVLMGDIGEQWNFAKLNQAFTQLMANPESELIALGMTRYFRGANGLQLDVGPFVQALAYATGRQPVVMGKPAPEFFLQACKQLQLEPASVCMIGDDARSDVVAAQAAGLKGALVQTGKFQPTDLEQTQPDYLLASIASVRDIFA